MWSADPGVDVREVTTVFDSIYICTDGAVVIVG